MNNAVHLIDSGRPVIKSLGNGALRYANAPYWRDSAKMVQ